ncbi:hypothetical protein C0584_02975 [Candidatus Parcubacteria bacterium]|nr:MAG: hypothetical protein C0584_02975 [Candidatus Parcubacteria bacterium]
MDPLEEKFRSLHVRCALSAFSVILIFLSLARHVTIALNQIPSGECGNSIVISIILLILFIPAIYFDTKYLEELFELSK